MNLNRPKILLEIEEIKAKLSSLTNLLDKDSVSDLDNTEIESLLKKSSQLDNHIFDERNMDIDPENRMDQLIDSMSSLAEFNFDKEVLVGDAQDDIDMFSLAYNMLRVRLKEKVETLERVRSYFNSINSGIVITDQKGIITETNSFIDDLELPFLNTNNGTLSISSFLNHAELRSKYSIDITDSLLEHNVIKSFQQTLNSDIVLRVSIRTLKLSFQGAIGVCYIFEPVSQSLYSQNDVRSNMYLQHSLNDICSSLHFQNLNRNLVLETIISVFKNKDELSSFESTILQAAQKELINNNGS